MADEDKLPAEIIQLLKARVSSEPDYSYLLKYGGVKTRNWARRKMAVCAVVDGGLIPYDRHTNELLVLEDENE